MSIGFAESLREEAKWTTTENGAIAKNTTNDALLDLFATIGALRERRPIEICTLFKKAYEQAATNDDKLEVIRLLFYARDIRGGLGERRTFRVIYNYLATIEPKLAANLIPFVAEYGRYDDLYCLLATPAENDMWKYVKKQLEADEEAMEKGEPCSLLAKWLKKPDTTSARTKALGIHSAKMLDMSVYDYKRLTKKLRRYINVVEIKMSENEWGDIEYSSVPSKAMLNYRNAFEKHDDNRYTEYLNKVEAGDAKINSSTLYPYDIVSKMLHFPDPMYRVTDDIDAEKEIRALQVLWDNLPNYLNGEYNAIVMADTSGSMTCNDYRPLSTAIGLAIYFAERNTGAFHNLFMQFSSNAYVIDLDGINNLPEKVRKVKSCEWGTSTNLDAAFNRILDIALYNDVPNDKMPKALIVVSDMEINSCTSQWGRETYSSTVERKFKAAGYDVPTLIFWNVNSRKNTFLADTYNTNTILVSGQSTAVFKTLMGSIGMTSEEYMLSVINSDRYQKITMDIFNGVE